MRQWHCLNSIKTPISGVFFVPALKNIDIFLPALYTIVRLSLITTYQGEVFGFLRTIYENNKDKNMKT